MNIQKYLFRSLPSTNDFAKEIAKRGTPEGFVIVAESQSEGKGRLGRSFSSPKDTGLYFSMILRPKFSPDDVSMITTAAAVAAAKAIEAVSGEKAYIKWVNDIYMRGKKVAGILTESSLNENNEMNFAVLGVGVNITYPEEGFEDSIKDIAGVIFENKPAGNTREVLLDKILEEFVAIYNTLPDKSYIEEYKKRSFLLNKNISFISGDEEINATVLDIDEDAHLVVKKSDGEIRNLSTGEVSIKKDEDFYKAFE